jgi:F-type H+-transporting ATPase subunit delta
MNESQISVRYAKALFESAADHEQLDPVYRDMGLLSDVCRQEGFQYMITLPSLKVSEKCKLADQIFKGHFSKLSLSMIDLVIKNKREAYLPGIARNFGDLYRKSKGIRTASLVTATPVDQASLQKVRDLIRSVYDSEVELSARVNKEVIGGFVLTVEDLQYDASVSGSLKKMKKQLLQTSIEK